MKVRAYNHVKEDRQPHSPDGSRLEWKTTRWESVRALAPDSFCCGEMREAWGDLIGFGEKESYLGNRDANVNLYDFGYGCWTEHRIRFCPFCGQAVEVELEDQPGEPR